MTPNPLDTRDVTALLRDLIRIPSVNPDGEPGADFESSTAFGEKNCAEYVGRFLESIGADVSFEEVLHGRPNVIGKFPSSGAKRKQKPRLLFAPHTDTVGVANMTIDPFGGDIHEGRIHGRGASDTKGSIAAMLWALRELKDRIPALDAEITFVGLMGEETGQPGSRHFAKAHAHEFDFAIVGEPTSLNIVHQHKGCLWIEISATGRAAHGATPEEGENAITKMASLLNDLDTEFRAQLATHTHPVLGHCTINVGTVHGGSRPNIVADRCSAVLDFRLTPSLPPRNALALLQAFLHERDTALILNPLLQCAPLDTDPAHPIIKRLLAIEKPACSEAASASNSSPAEASREGRVALVGAPWFCDAAVLATPPEPAAPQSGQPPAAGIPSVAVGPGSIAQAHTKDEYLAIDELENGVTFFRRFLESFSS